MKASEIKIRGAFYRNAKGRLLYIFPMSKVPIACGPVIQGRIPYRVNNHGRHIYGTLPPDYIVEGPVETPKERMAI